MRKIPDNYSSENRRLNGSRNLPAVKVVNNQRPVSLTPLLSQILCEVQRELGYLRKDQREEIAAVDSSEVLQLINRISLRLGVELSSYERDHILDFLEKEQRPFGILQDLVDDPAVSDIIVSDYSKVVVQQGRSNYMTEVTFPSQEYYEAYVEKLLHRAGASYSTKKPIADGMIGSFARIHAVHKSLCDTGPYLTIRLNRFSTVTLSDLEESGLAPKELLDYLSSVVRTGNTILIVGEVATGKTTLARALAATIPLYESILVIEDTPEIRLEHPHVRYITTREENTDGAGRVTSKECIRGGMRMAMNRIIFGEMRDAEAAEAFIDVCASGHPGLSTLHARSAQEALTRLELFLGRAQRGVDRAVLREQIVTAVQVIVRVDICRKSGKRRIFEVREIGPVADGVMRQREMFKYSFSEESGPRWNVVTKISRFYEEAGAQDVNLDLSRLPSFLEFNMEQTYSEAARYGVV
ncbi:MAG: CpaF family protein [Candidatus Dadabacteria bacterium]|nr:MAG: CpaF family protein [Candidatus Dadabacteria bacterium]